VKDTTEKYMLCYWAIINMDSHQGCLSHTWWRGEQLSWSSSGNKHVDINLMQ